MSALNTTLTAADTSSEACPSREIAPREEDLVKGVIFNLLEEVVRREYGEDTWDSLIDAAGLDGVYTSLGSYPEEQLMKLVGAASAALGLPADEVVRWFGRGALSLLAERYPEFFEPHTSTLPFLLTLNEIIHPEVRKIYPGADVPEFRFDSSEESVLIMDYQSSRKLCALAEGLIEGAAAYYGERVVLEHPSCTKRGDLSCLFRVSLKGAALAA